MGRLGSGPHVVGRLRSTVWCSASFQIFALTAGRMSRVRREIVQVRKMSGGDICPTRPLLSYYCAGVNHVRTGESPMTTMIGQKEFKESKVK